MIAIEPHPGRTRDFSCMCSKCKKATVHTIRSSELKLDGTRPYRDLTWTCKTCGKVSQNQMWPEGAPIGKWH